MHPRITTNLFAAAFATIIIAAPHTGWATETVSVRGGSHPDFNRLVFDFNKAPKYQVKQDGSQVTITFQAAVDLNVTKSAAVLPQVAGLNSQQQDNKTIVTFNVPAKAAVSDFQSGTGIVIDVKGNGKAVAAPVVAPPQTSAATEKSSEKSVDKSAEKPAAPEKPKAETSVPTTAAPATSAPASPALPEPKAEPAIPAPTDEVAAQPVPPPPEMINPMANVQNRPPTFIAPANTDLPVVALSAVPTPIMQFDPRDNMPAVVFKRGDYMYVAFDRHLRFDIRNLFATNLDAARPEAVTNGNFSAYQFPVPANSDPILSKTETMWQVDVVSQGSNPPSAVARDLTPRSDPLYSMGARMIVPLIGGGKILSFIDPVVGDTLILIPTATVNERVMRGRRYADFELLPTLQGIVIRVINESLKVRMIEEGVEITAYHGLNLSTGNIATEEKIAETGEKPQPAMEEIIPLTSWRQESLGNFIEALQALQERIAETSGEERDKNRFDLIRFYLGYAMGSEALGIMDMLTEKNIDIAARPEFQLLQAIALILNNQPDDGLVALAKAGFSDNNEIRLWRAAGLAESRKFAEAATDFKATLLLLENYPSPFAERFAILAAESFIATADDPSAARMIDLMVARKSNGVLREAAVQYLRGIMQARSGNLTEARKLWTKATESDDYLYRVRAELALVDLELSTNNMTYDEAAKKLEGLRFAWRGDELELEMLNRLADYQLKSNHPTDAMDTLERAKRIYPNSTRDAELTNQQRAIFRKIFLENAHEKVVPMQMLALYDRYKVFSPIDSKERLVILNDVVDEMVAIDLLPQAIGVLEPELQGNATPEEKDAVALRLTALNLLNGEPEKAAVDLKAIDDSKLTDGQRQDKKLLQARMLSDSDKNAEAIQLLTGDTSPDALRLTSTAAWRSKQWALSAQALEGIMPPVGAELTSDTAQIVLARAIALSLANDSAALAKLNTDYSAMMSKQPQGQAFTILADKSVVTGATNLAKAQEQTKDVDLFQGFLDNYKKAK